MTVSNENMVTAVARTVYDISKAARDRGVLTMWTVFDHPKDFPTGYMARCFETGGGGPEPVATDYAITGSLDLISQSMETCGLVCMARDPSDDPVIVETWL